ncbi:MAG: hypothetical protein CMI79_06855 [Candidatus Pelagibacter sp.]|nr:hypothetical protein [Candidatus Pelagibacter sp.]|tara:strand:+ start:5195 stop:6127 length:933 start_codon:yes stop_codon:yes gene_type:complete
MQNNSNKNKYLLTVIIPFYNIGNQFNKCIKRLNNIRDERLEIIFVDDGSTKNLNNKYFLHIQKRENYKLIKLNKNKGPGVARNNGIKFSKGEFLIFLDSDDKLKHKNLIKLLDYLEREKNREIIFFNYFKKKNRYKINLSKKKIEKYKIIKLFLRTELEMCSNFYCFKKNFLTKYKIKFSSGYYEDIVFMLKNFYYMRRFHLFKLVIYEKIDNKKSITNTYSKKHLLDFLRSVKMKVNFFKQKIKKNNLVNDLQFGLRGDYIFSKKISNNYDKFKSSHFFIDNFFKKIISKEFKVITSYDKKVLKELFYK